MALHNTPHWLVSHGWQQDAKRDISKYLNTTLQKCIHHQFYETTQNHEKSYNYIIIIIIIKKTRQCKAGRGRFIPYRSNDPSPTITTYNKEEKRKTVENNKLGSEQPRPIKKHWLFFWNPPVPHHWIQGRQDRYTGTLIEEWKSCGTARFFIEEAHYSIPMWVRSTTCNPHWHIW